MADPVVFTRGVVPGLAGLARDISDGFDRRAELRSEREDEEAREAAAKDQRIAELQVDLQGQVETARQTPGRDPNTKTRVNPRYAQQLEETAAARKQGENPPEPAAFVQDTVLPPEAQTIADMDSQEGSQEAKDRVVNTMWQIANDPTLPVAAAAVKDALNAYHMSRFDFQEEDLMELGARVEQLDRQMRADAAGAGPQSIMEATRQLASEMGLEGEQVEQAAVARARQAFPGFDPNIRTIQQAVTDKLTEVYEHMPEEETAKAMIDAEYQKRTGKEAPPGLYNSTTGEREALKRHMPEASRLERDQLAAGFIVGGESVLDAIGRATGDNKLRFDGYARNLAQAGLDATPSGVQRLISLRPEGVEERDADMIAALKMAAPDIADGDRMVLVTAPLEGGRVARTMAKLTPRQQAQVDRVFIAFGRGGQRSPDLRSEFTSARQEGQRARTAEDRDLAELRAAIIDRQDEREEAERERANQTPGSRGEPTTYLAPPPNPDAPSWLRDMREANQ